MTFYLYIKALHIIAVISWMAGMLYLPRLFVYHSNIKNSKETNNIFIMMEKRLLRFIMNPALILTWVFGGILVFHPSSIIELTATWFVIKIVFVVVMSGIHGYFAYCRKMLQKDNTFYSQRFFKYLNEVPTILMLIIVIMVVVKPFN